VIAFSPTMHFSYSSGSRCCYPKANAVWLAIVIMAVTNDIIKTYETITFAIK
jgi:hypothetical protein